MKTTGFIIELSESPNTDFGKKEFTEQSFAQKVFTSVFGSSGSIFMDGFALYFVNSDGENAHFAPEAYRHIGAPKSAKIIQEASRVLSPNPIPADGPSRELLVKNLSEEDSSRLNDLDQAFYTTREIIDDLLFDFVSKHPEAFGPVPDGIEKHGGG